MESSSRTQQEPSDVSTGDTPTTITVIFREIHKNAWLRRLPTGERKTAGAYSKRGENVWVVFCVHDDRDPYLEVYLDQKVATAHKPEWCAPLSACLHVSPTICATQEDQYEFVVTLRSGIVRLAAPSWDIMMEWVESLRSKLSEMKILSPKENYYSRQPEQPRGPLLPTRDPNSPLPPTPAGPLILVPGTEVTLTDTAFLAVVEAAAADNTSDHSSSSSSSSVSSSSPQSQTSQPIEASSLILDTSLGVQDSTTRDSSRDNVRLAATSTTSLYITQSEPPVYSRPLAILNRTTSEPGQNVTVIEVDGPVEPSTNVFDFNFLGNSLPLDITDSHYEHLHLGTSQPPTPSPALPLHSPIPTPPPRPTHPHPSDTPVPSSPPPQTSTEPRRHAEITRRTSRRSQEERTGRSAGEERTLQPAPFPLRATPTSPVLTLREQQVLHLNREMWHAGGVRLQLRRKDCLGSIALVDAFGAVWVAGWKQREHPTLYNALHIGDRLLSIAGVPAPTSMEAHRLIKAANCIFVDVVVRRLPFAKVFAIRRDTEGQDLGLETEGGTSEIKSIRPSSPAARAGLPPKSRSCDGLSLCNWVLTEVNSRPLNLFFKDGEVKDRLNAVGMDISILVQPYDLVKQLKKQLKSLRSYKEYLVQ